jgi:hypothetical protein
MIQLFRRFRKKSSAPIIINVIDEEYALEFCLQWNLHFPVDRWYRHKHKIAFNSPAHRSVSLWDMRFEFEEEQLFYKKDQIQDYAPNKGDWVKIDLDIDEDINLTEAEKLIKYKKEFAEMNLDQYKIDK